MEQELERQQIHFQSYSTPRGLIRSEVFVQPQCVNSTSIANTKPLLFLFGALAILGMGFYLGLQMMSGQMALISKQNAQVKAQNQTLLHQNAQIQQQLNQTQTAISQFKNCLAKSGL